MKKQNDWLIALFLGLHLLLFSCSLDSTELESALYHSGANRIELETVLNYYRNIKPDSLKLEAAKYLIVNMPKHFSYNETSVKYYDGIDSILRIETNDDTIRNKIERFSKSYEDKIVAIEDIKYIKADYIIANIEKSFEAWKKPWAKHLGFGEFCEYILPYKLAEFQNMDNWKDDLFTYYDENMNRLSLCQDYKYSSVAIASLVDDNLKVIKKGRNIIELNTLPICDAHILLKLPFASCYDCCLLTSMIMRSKGIPVAIDFTPQWPDRRAGHSWNVVLSSNRGKNVLFAGSMENAGEDPFYDTKMAKVFRHTFAANKELSEINLSPVDVPKIFKNIFIKDVTEEYMNAVDVSITLNDDISSSHKYAYLCVFDNNNWTPIYWGKINKRIASFSRMGKNIVYLPVIYSNNRMHPIGSAFLLNEQGEVKPIKYNKIQKESITINRKFPILKHIYDIKWMLINGKIQAANKSTFEDSVTIANLPEWDLNSGSVSITNPNKYRYFRFMSSANWYCDMAELFFYERDSILPIKSKNTFIHDKSNQLVHTTINPLEDRDLLTYFSAFKDSTWIGFDFGSPVCINKLSYIRRGDGNAISIGDSYELYYWDDYRWILIAKQKADDVSLTFSNVPRNSLLYIKNSLTGYDNRIFMYRAGEILWY